MNQKNLTHALAIAAACASIGLVSPASAQVAVTKGTPAAPAPAPAPAAPAPAPATTTVPGTPVQMAAPAPAPVTVSPEARAAIKDLLDAMNMREYLSKNFQGMPQAIAPQLANAVARQVETNATLTPDQKTKVLEGLKVPFDTSMREVQGIVTSPKMVDDTLQKMYPVYAKNFTLPEIKQLSTFYRTPAGSKTLGVMTQAIGESLQATVADLQPRLGSIMDKMLKTQIDAVTAKK